MGMLFPYKDETKWIKVEKLIRNVSKALEFFLPTELAEETPYSIVVKTNSSKGNSSTVKKSYSVTYSPIVKVKAA